MRLVPCVLSSLIALMIATAGAPAQGQETIKLKLTHPLPATHFLYVQGIKKFTDAVSERTKGKVQFEAYPASMLGSDHFTALQSSLADVAMLVTSYYPDKFPMSAVTELPGLYSSSCEATAKVWQLAKPGGLLQKYEYGPRGLHILFVHTLASYYLNTTSKKVETLDDVHGLRFWATGAGMSKIIQSLGAVPVKMVGSELYDSLSRGTLDGAYINYPAISQYNVDKQLRYTVQGVQLGSGTWVFAMKEKAWKALPKSVQDIMTSAGAEAQSGVCKWMDGDSDNALKKLVAGGMVVTTLSPEQAKLWQSKVNKVDDEWAAEMNANGRHGTELLDFMRKAPAASAK